MIATTKGLEHIVMGDSTISLVAGETGGLVLRGFDIKEVARRASYEDIVHLLLYGEPPTAAQSADLRQRLLARRAIPGPAAAVLDALPPGLPPLDALRTLLSALGDGAYPYPPTVEQGLDLIARTPTLLARYVRRSRGLPPVAPRPDLSHVANYAWMLSGSVPTSAQSDALETYFVLLADHGMNASTLALRVVISTESDLFSAATAALGALKGPAHGGAPSRVSDMLDAVGSSERAEEYIRRELDARRRLYGFGHRAYKTDDPRALILRDLAPEVAEPARLKLAGSVERVALDELHRRRPQQRLYTNVEYWSAVVLEGVGLSRDMFTPTFAAARTAGWTAHALEQAADNRLIRPDVRYVGPPAGRRWPEELARRGPA